MDWYLGISRNADLGDRKMTTVSKIEVSKVDRGPKMGGIGYAVFVHAERGGNKIKTCIETGLKDDMNKRAKAHAKKWGVSPILA